MWRPMSMILIALIWPSVLCNAWSPETNEEFRSAIKECIRVSTDCLKGPRGAIGSWDIYVVTDMRCLFIDEETVLTDDPKPLPGADKFNGDLSKWEVLSVMNMQSMFHFASSFNADLSKWDVSSVNNMGAMFGDAASFNADLSKWDV